VQQAGAARVGGRRGGHQQEGGGGGGGGGGRGGRMLGLQGAAGASRRQQCKWGSAAVCSKRLVEQG
jgi:hypothetical protein